jgi:predicted type IV restriction endonuclease
MEPSMAVSKKVAERIERSLKTFRVVLEQQKARDVSEADTVTLVKDLLSDVFGYDKYAELTSEHSIRGTYCDLAVKLDAKLTMLIEVKAIGSDLKDSHVKQAVDYASNQGCEWVVLTNAIEWRLYKVLFRKPIDKQEIAHFNLLTARPKDDDDLEKIYLLTREGFTKSSLEEYSDRKDATSRYMLAAVILNSDGVKNAIRREIRRTTEINVEEDIIERVLREEVIKRETIEGAEAEAASRRVNKCADKKIRNSEADDDIEDKAAPTPPENKASDTAKPA